MAKNNSTRASHTPMWQPVLISLFVSRTQRKSQFLGFLDILKSINTY
ncbi:hypothetical protein F383_34125 [Gossypium arboreum]|uniref:Uncharacterized protein n=1 Tax=Gossypium arboreum TaxID=29729 RepID=A0A0B0N414_GOSAR|nr:hypothetical protein F383_34125 [Gossypium arboreum]